LIQAYNQLSWKLYGIRLGAMAFSASCKRGAERRRFAAGYSAFASRAAASLSMA